MWWAKNARTGLSSTLRAFADELVDRPICASTGRDQPPHRAPPRWWWRPGQAPAMAEATTGAVRVEKVRGRSALTRCFAKYPLKLIAPTKVGPSSCDAVWLYALTYGGGIVSVSPKDDLHSPFSPFPFPTPRCAVDGHSRFGGCCCRVMGSGCPCRGTPYRARSASATGARRPSPRRPPPRYTAVALLLFTRSQSFPVLSVLWSCTT